MENQLALEKVSSEYKQADSTLAALNKISKDQTGLDTIKKTATSYLPDEPSASEFIIGLEQMTSQIPIIIDSLSVNEIKTKAVSKTATSSSDSADSSATTTKTATTKASEKALKFDASFKTSYDNVLIFFRKMEQNTRFNTIETITMGSYNVKDSTLNFSAEGKIYYGK